jgi:YVTN family beta-propeller protein
MARIPPIRRASQRGICSGRRLGRREPLTDRRAWAVTAVTVVFMVAGTLTVAVTGGVAAADSVTTTIPVGDDPTAVALNPAGTSAYVANLEDNTLSVIDVSTQTVTATIPVGIGPDGVAINPAGTDAYVANSNYATYDGYGTVSVIDLSTDTVTATIPVGAYASAVVVNPAGTDAYVLNQGFGGQEGTVSVIDLSTDTVTATILAGGAYALAINPAGTDIYVSEFGGPVEVIDLSTRTVTATIPVAGKSTGVAVDPAGTHAYVADFEDGTVEVIDLSTNTVTATIPVGGGPFGVAVNPAGTDAYVTGGDEGTLSVIDLRTDTVTATVAVGAYPSAVAVNPAGTDAYVTNESDNTVSVVSLIAAAPKTPDRPTVTDGDHRATVSVTAPSAGDTPTSYAVTAADTTHPGRGSQTCTIHGATGACQVAGLTNGDTYTFTVTASNPVGTSPPSPASSPVTPAPPADLAVTLNGPGRVADGATFTENVTVTDHGPGNATHIAITMLIPAGLTVTSAAGASIRSGTLTWADPSLPSTVKVIYPVTFNVGAPTYGPAIIGAIAQDDGYDPNLSNNAAITTVQLLAPTKTQRTHGRSS